MLPIKNFRYKEFVSLGIQINYWQCLKWQNKLDGKTRKQIEQVELETRNNKFKLAIYALLDNEADFFKTVPLALRSKDVDKDDLTEWPIFREMRKNQRFAKILKIGQKSKKGSKKDKK